MNTQEGTGPILIVEDDEDIRETIADLLVDEGYPIVVAADGAEALRLLHGAGAQRPRLILLDLMMPVMNAWDFRKELVKDEQLADVPIVLLSGDARVMDKSASFGAVRALLKPISLVDLLNVVSECGVRPSGELAATVREN